MSQPTNDTTAAPMQSANTFDPVAASLSEFAGMVAPPVVAESSETVPTLDPHSIDSVLTREYLIHNFTINGTEIINANLLGAFDPFSKLLQTPMVAAAVKPYRYFRGDIRIVVRVTPPGSCYGAMILSAICEGGLDATPNATVNTVYGDDLAVDSLYNAFNDTFQIVNFENASAVSFELPYVYHSHYIKTDGVPVWMWRLQMQSLVPLQSTISTTAAATVKIYASFLPGYELSIPCYQAKKHVTGLDGLREKRDHAVEAVSKITGGMKVSDIASSVGGLAAKAAGAIPMLAPFAAPVAAGAAAISSIASFFGFTREAMTYPPETTVHRLFSATAGIDGVDTSDSVTLMAGSVLSIDPALGGGTHEDIMSFEYLRQRWGCVGYFDLTTSTAPGAVIYSLPVTPMYAGVNLGRLYFTPAGYYGLPFDKWRGGMEYLIYVPSATNMCGMLQVCYSPDVRNTAPPHTLSDPTNQVHTVSLDLSGTQQHLIQIPYASPEPCKYAVPMCDGKFSQRLAKNANGCLDFYLSTSWSAPRAGVLTTRVFIIARPMSDMVFTDTRTHFDLGGSTGRGLMDRAIVMQSKVDLSVGVFESSLLSQPLEETFNLAQSCTTEVAPSSRALCQKFTSLNEPTKTPFFVMNHFLCPSTTNTAWKYISYDDGYSGPLTVPWTWMTHYSLLFTGIRGGVRVKVVPTCNTTGEAFPSVWCPAATTIKATNKDVSFWHTSDSAHQTRQVVDWEHAAEFSFPYISPRLYWNPRRYVQPPSVAGVGGDSLDYGRLVAFRQSNPVGGVSGPNLEILHAGSSDFSATRFRRAPSVVAAFLIPADT